MLDILLDIFYLEDMGERSKQKSVGVTLCVGCGNEIYDQYILRVSPDLEWHAACLKCVECSRHLDETSTCFVRNGKTYCKSDYMWLFGIKCSKCNKVISRNDLVMRARENVYHMGCFRCSACCRHLLPGDEFFLRDEELLCRADHGAVLDLTDNDQSPKQITHVRPLITEPASARRPPHHRNHVHSASEKTTRVRTVLNEKQLHTLRTCYNANPRPDALMKEQLVEMTGLSPRVIRVWFQNKRCKDKKRSLLLKQNLKGLTGTALLASSPLPPETGVEGEPVEVHAHQLLWKSLCDFSLHRVHEPPILQVSLSDSGGSSAGSDSLSSHLPDTPSSMVFSPEDT